MSETIQTTLPAIKTRDPWLDNAKGILMILVVLGHAVAPMTGIYGTMAFLYVFINAFHMPAFMMVSGYLSKRRVEKKDAVTMINKDLVMYITAQILVFLFMCWVPGGFKAAGQEDMFSASKFTFLVPAYQLWYLMSILLFTFFCMAVQPQKKGKIALPIALILSVAVGFFPTVFVLKFSKSVAFFPFFLMGLMFGKEKLMKLRDKTVFRVLGVFVLLFYAVFMWYGTKHGWFFQDMFAISTRFSHYPKGMKGLYPPLTRAAILLFIPLVSAAFLAVCPRKKSIFTRLGERSAYIFVLHVVFIFLIRFLNSKFKIFALLDSPLKKLIYLVVVASIAFLLATDPVYKIFRPILEPHFDIRKIPAYFRKNDRMQQN